MPKRVKTASLNTDLQGSSKRARPEPQACLRDSSVREARAKPCVLASTLQPACWVPEGTPPTAPAPRDSLASSLTRGPVASGPRTVDPPFPGGARAEVLRQHAALRRLARLPAPGRCVPVEGLGSGPTRPIPNQATGRGSGAGSAALEPSSSGTAGFWGGAAPCAAPEPAACASADRADASADADGGWAASRVRAAGSAPCRAACKRPGKGLGAVSGAAAAGGGHLGGRGPPARVATERPLGPQGNLTASMAQRQRMPYAGAAHAARNRALIPSK